MAESPAQAAQPAEVVEPTVHPDEAATASTTAIDGGVNTAAGPNDDTTNVQDDQHAAIAARGRSREIIAEDAFSKKAVSLSPSRSSLSAALHAHASPIAALSPAGSGANTPADITTEEQIERLKSKVTDLASQVTSLNGKLVASYNRVGNLEDDADQKVMEIKTLTSKIEKLEAERKTWEDKYEGGLLVEKVCCGHSSGNFKRSKLRCAATYAY